MGKKKTSQATTNTYSYIPQPQNQYYDQAASQLSNLDYTTDVINAYGQNENIINESGNEFFGDNTPAGLRESSRESRLFQNNIQKGAAINQAKQAENNAKIGGYMSLGGATAPNFVQSGGTTVNTSPWNWSKLFFGDQGIGGTAASAAG